MPELFYSPISDSVALLATGMVILLMWRAHKLSRMISIMLLSVSWTAGLYSIHLKSPQLLNDSLERSLIAIGSVIAVLCWTLFVLRFCALERFLRWPFLALVLFGSTLSGLLILTNPLHELWFKDGEKALLALLNDVYSLVLVIATCVLLLQQLNVQIHAAKKRVVILLLASCAALSTMIFSIANLSSTASEVVFLASFLLLGMGVILALRKKQSLVPVARDMVFDDLQDGLIVLDKDLRIADMNETAKELLGLDDFSVGQDAMDVLYYLGFVKPSLLSEESMASSFVGLKELELRSSPLIAYQEDALGVLLQLIDRTEQKMTERTVHDAKERYKDLLKVSDRRNSEIALLHMIRDALSSKKERKDICETVISMTSKSLGYTMVSLTMRHEDGWKLEHHVGCEAFPELFPKNEGVLGRVTRNATAELLQNPDADPDWQMPIEGLKSAICAPLFIRDEIAGTLNVQSLERTLYKSDLELVKAIATYTGTALERIQFLEDLEEGHKKYRALVENADDIIYAISLDGYFQYVNPKLSEVSGYLPDELIGMHFLELIRDDYKEQTMEFYVQQFRSKIESTRYKFPIISITGKEHWIEQNVKLVWQDKRIVSMQASARDVTERVRVLEALEQRTKALESSNSDLEQFAFIAAHDLQEPLRKLQTFSDRLAGKYADLLDEQAHNYLARIQASADRMQRLIHDIQMFTHLGREKRLETVDLNHVYSTVRKKLKLVIERTGARIHLKPLPSITADAEQFQLLFFQLLSNSLKFRRDDVEPSISIEYRFTKDRQFELQVKDNGAGFDNFYVDRIFMVFQTLHSQKEKEGNGIGLAICRKIVEGHSGTITAESEVGVGTRIIMRFPQSIIAKNKINTARQTNALSSYLTKAVSKGDF